MEKPIHQFTYSYFWNNRDTLILVYEGNILGRYVTGFAKKVEHLPNAYGIPTRRSDCEDTSVCFLNDNMFDLYAAKMEEAMSEIEDSAKKTGREVVLSPKFALGRAELDKRAPRLYEFLMIELKARFNYGS